MKIPETTMKKLKAVKHNSKYHLTTKDKKNHYYVTLHSKKESLKIPFKAMFFKEVNTKLGKILSISNSATHCESHRQGYCQLNDPENECYALKTENQYRRQDIINSYEANLISGLILTAANMDYVAKYINQEIKPDYIRYNKHGDFINHQQFLKLLELTSKTPQTIYYGYTARDDILTQYNITGEFLKDQLPNLKINGSNKKYTNRFKVTYNLKEYHKAKYKCLGNCSQCQKCFKLQNQTITVLYHGSNAEAILNTPENQKYLSHLLKIPITNFTGKKLITTIHKHSSDLKKYQTTKELITNLKEALQ